MQLGTASPLSMTVQQPQAPSSQPRLAAVSPRRSRSVSSSVSLYGTWPKASPMENTRSTPLTYKVVVTAPICIPPYNLGWAIAPFAKSISRAPALFNALCSLDYTIIIFLTIPSSPLPLVRSACQRQRSISASYPKPETQRRARRTGLPLPDSAHCKSPKRGQKTCPRFAFRRIAAEC